MGSYVNSGLAPGEQVVYEGHLHWIVFFSSQALLTLFVAPLIQRATYEYAITNKRVIIKTGFISRYTYEMPHSKVESISVNQSILGRILGFGDLIIIGTGGSREPFTKVARPLLFRKKFQETVDQYLLRKPHRGL